MKMTAYKLNRYFSRELEEAQSELRKWGNWNKRHKYDGAPNPDPKSLAGKIFTISRGDQPAPMEIRKIARVIWFMGNESLQILWSKYVLDNKMYGDNAVFLAKAENTYMVYRNFWPGKSPADWAQDPPINDFF